MKQWLNDNLFIAGRTGAGKSYYFEHEILPKLIHEDHRQIILLDFKDQYKVGHYIDINDIEGPFHLAKIMTGEYNKGKKPKLVNIKTGRFTVDRIEMIFSYLNQTQNKILIMEEGAFFFRKLNSRNLPEECEVYIRTQTGGHNANHNFILITQYPNDIPGSVIDAFSNGFLFFLPPRALTYLHHTNFLMAKPMDVFRKIAPFKSYKFFQVGVDDMNLLYEK